MLWGASLKSFEGPACAQGYLWSNAIRVGYPGLSWNWLDSSRRFSPLWFSLIFYSILGFTRYNMDLRTSIYGVAWGNKTRSWFLAASLTRRLLLLNGTVCFFARSLKFGLWEWYSKIDLMWSIFYMYIGTPQKIFAQGPISVQFSCSVMSNSSAISWTIAHQAHLSMVFPRQEYWSGLPFPYPGDLPNPGIEPTSPALAGRFFTVEPSGNPFWNNTTHLIERLEYSFI